MRLKYDFYSLFKDNSGKQITLVEQLLKEEACKKTNIGADKEIISVL